MTGLAPLPSPPITGGATPADGSRLATRANLDQAAARFEALFIGMMLKSARAASLGDGLLDSEAMTQFRDMQDVHMAETMANRMPIGIGRALADFLAQRRPDLAENAGGDGAGGKETGG
ncbi:rod-binding protein [Sphingomonas changnyeongensis]|nr:rod-binding protein [Sphingomonas changnyeongensis]